VILKSHKIKTNTKEKPACQIRRWCVFLDLQWKHAGTRFDNSIV